MTVVVIVLVAIVALMYYRHDVRRHPRVRCRACTGSGSHRSRLGGGRLRRPFGACRCCGGRQSHPRLAARFLAPESYQEEKRKIEQGKAKL